MPVTFRPIPMERVWGGWRLAGFGKALPPGVPIGESWELVDRPGVQSVVETGAPVGTTLHELWTRHRREIFGDVPDAPRFPLLAKLLDARETLSVQVHPPAAVARQLGGEPKTEMWHLLDAEPGAVLYAGFRRGTTRADFERAAADGSCERLLHKIPVCAGDSIFIPSGRCHAIGAGCLIVEMQQNSDTTYRVFDWNRVPARELHFQESMLSIDFSDVEPALAAGEIACEHFHTVRWRLDSPRVDESTRCVIFTVLSGEVACGGSKFQPGAFFLLPASAADRTLAPSAPGTAVLRTTF